MPPSLPNVLRIAAALLLVVGAASLEAAGFGEAYPQWRTFFPEATRIGEPQNTPPAAPVYRGDRLVGYALLSTDVVQIPAYSGRPIATLIGFDLAGKITGVEIVQHEEPILVIGISNERLQDFARQYVGKSVFDRISVGGVRPGHVTIDAISGATITMMVENASIMQSVRKVAEARGLRPPGVRAAAPASAPAETPEPIWRAVWRERTLEIGVLVAGLGFLTLILVFQDWLAWHPKLLRRVRNGFLAYTLFFIGWYGLAQLSAMNVLTFVQAIMRGFQWESFLIDPMLFLLWSFVAVTLLLWGRGVYCGWLCPFGALQELSFQLAQKFRVPHFELPPLVHERLWALKYIILLTLFGLSLQSLTAAERYIEIEPFKTAITMRFLREGGFVFYAAGLVVFSIFNRKFYCKYLCPLGAALTIAGRFRIFDWLRRHRECGRPCQVCGVECEVQAIKKNGEINANECHYCLDCQVTYWNDQKCPPMVERRRRRDKAGRARELVRGMETALGPSGIGEIPVRVEPRREPGMK